MQHGKENLNILEDEIRTFIAVLLLPEYCKVPFRNLYWADAPDTQNEAVSCVMSRNRFRKILSNLYLDDNTQITEDRYCKVGVLFEKLNFNFKQYGSFVSHSVDENIIPYYGKHGTKEFIRGESIRLGLNFGASSHLMVISLMQNHIVEQILICQMLVWVRVQMLCWVWFKQVR